MNGRQSNILEYSEYCSVPPAKKTSPTSIDYHEQLVDSQGHFKVKNIISSDTAH